MSCVWLVRVQSGVRVPVEQVGTCVRLVSGSEPVRIGSPALHASAARRVVHRIRNPEEAVRVGPLALMGDAQVCSAALQAAPARFDTEVVHSCPGGPTGRGAALRPPSLRVRLPSGVRSNTHGGAEQPECSRPCQGRDREFESRRHRAIAIEVGYAAGHIPERCCRRGFLGCAHSSGPTVERCQSGNGAAC